MMSSEPAFTVSEFVAVLNQSLAYAYPAVTITGEMANFRISKNRWVYFDLKDEASSVRFFGTVYQMPGPLEDGMMVVVRGMPRLHAQYGFSVTVESVRPAGEGSIKKAAVLLQAKLAAEGLFDDDRKRTLPYPPQRIGLITSGESAAYRDFVKIISARWGGLEITLIDVQVQGEASPRQIVQAVQQFNQLATPPEVLVITRGGGSAEDLQAFSTEQVTRAVAASRIPTVVAIGHEVDTSLAELAADKRASTPSNAAELLVPDKRTVLDSLQENKRRLSSFAERHLLEGRRSLRTQQKGLYESVLQVLAAAKQKVALQNQLLHAYNPQEALVRGYAILRHGNQTVKSGKAVDVGDTLHAELHDSELTMTVQKVTMHSKEQSNAKKSA